MARCKGCHRELTDALSLSRGYGPTCWQRVLRAGGSTSSREQTTHDLDEGHEVVRLVLQLERVQRGQQALAELWSKANAHLSEARSAGSTADVAQVSEAEWRFALVNHWIARARRLEQRLAVHLRQVKHRMKAA